jgi:hypothetical protein
MTRPQTKEDEKKLKDENEWYKFLKNREHTRKRAVRNVRPAGKYFSSGQRRAVSS